MRTRYGVDSRLNQSHALDFVDQAHNYARLERQKGVAFYFKKPAVNLYIGIGNPRVQRFWFSLGSGD